MKKTLSTILSILLALSITGCGSAKKTAIAPTVKPTAAVSTSAAPIATLVPTPTITTSISTPAPVLANDIDDDIEDITVYVTNSGKKYHQSGCQYLANSKIAISLDEAELEGYEPCSKCCW